MTMSEPLTLEEIEKLSELEKAATPGASRTDKGWAPERRCWRGMRTRCLSPSTNNYADYGGRGIRICERWLASFENFLADMGPRPSPQHSLDRIDNDGNYEPGNCRWATRNQQQRNKRNSRTIMFRGEKRSVIEVGAIVGVNPETIKSRMRYGVPESDWLKPALQHIKLGARDILDIQRRRAAGEQILTIARSYGVHTRAIREAVQGKRWRRFAQPLSELGYQATLAATPGESTQGDAAESRSPELPEAERLRLGERPNG